MNGSTDTTAPRDRARRVAVFWNAPALPARVRAVDRAIVPVLLVALVCGACVARIVLLQRYYIMPDADQTIIGLMARHIMHGERPLFYWGQPYTGSGEAYVTGALFALFGQSDMLLHVVPLAASVMFVVLTTILALRLYGLSVAWLTGLYLALPPAILLDWGLWAGSGYLEAMALGTAALLLVLPSQHNPRECARSRQFAAFFLLGLALWVQPLAGYYIVAVTATLVGPFFTAARSPRRWATGLLTTIGALTAFVLGSAPLIIFNAQHNGATLGFLADRATHLGPMTVLGRLTLWASPVLLGLMPPTTDQKYFLTFMERHFVLYGAALALVLLVLFRVASRWRVALAKLRAALLGQPALDTGIVVLAVIALGGYLATGWGAEQWAGSQPRYLLPLYSAAPLVMRVMLPACATRWHLAIATALVAALIAGNLFVINTNFPRKDVRPLALLLQERGITAIYGDYWLVYPVTYYSDERVVGVAVRDDLGNLRNNRYRPYLRAAAATADYAWVVQIGSTRERSVLACLHQLHSRYTTYRWSDQLVISRPSGNAFPWWNGGRCRTQSNVP